MASGNGSRDGGPWGEDPWGQGTPPDPGATGPQPPEDPWGEPPRPERPWRGPGRDPRRDPERGSGRGPGRDGRGGAAEVERALAAARDRIAALLGGRRSDPGRGGPGRDPGHDPWRGEGRPPAGRGPQWRDWGGLGPWRGGGLAALVVVLAWLASGLFRVQPDEQGVVLRFGAYDRTVGPGLNYHLPWPVERVLLPAVTRINRIEIGYRGGDPSAGGEDAAAEPSEGLLLPLRLRGRAPATPVRDLAEESQMLTGDENIVDINFAVFWRIGDAHAFLFNTRNPERTVRSAAESVMREVIGRTPIQSVLTGGRAGIEEAVMAQLQSILDQYGAGVEVTQVQLQRVDPPAAVIESFRDVQRANTDADRMRNEAQAYANDIVPRARGDAAAIVAGADAGRQAAIAAATGEAQRFASVDRAYQAARAITLERLYLDAMGQVLSRTPVTVLGGAARGVLPLLPLGGALPGGLAEGAAPREASGGAATAGGTGEMVRPAPPGAGVIPAVRP